MKLIKTLLLSFFSAVGFGQTLEPYEYVDKNYKVTTKANAEYSVYLEMDPRIARNNKTAFYADGSKRRYQEFANYSTGLLDGVTEEFYPSGKLLSRTTYIKGKPEGTSTRYWEDGKIKRESVFVNGVQVSEKCFDRSGTEVAVYPMYARPEFPGGVENLYKYIIKNISTRNMRPNSTGKLTAAFTVGIDGKLSNIRIVRGIDPLIDAAYIDVLKKSPRWKPALEENEPVPMDLTLPINLIEGNNNDDFYTAFD